MPRTSLLLALALGGCAAPGDLHVVALDDASVTLSSATASLSAIWLDDCSGGAVQVEVVGPVDLLSDAPVPLALPAGGWCGLSLWFEDDPVAGSLALEGLAGNTPFSIGLNPSVVVIPQDLLVDAEDWVLVLEGHTLLTGRLPETPDGLAVAPGDPLADTLTVALPDALWLGKVTEARDHLYIDLWPFPDVTFDGGSASLSVSTGGCGGDPELPDNDLDGIPDLDDDDDDNDGIFDLDDDDDDNDGLLDGDDPQTPGSPGGGGGAGADDGGGGCSGGSSTDSGSGGSGGGCDGGSSTSSGDGCDGGASGPSCSGGVDCGGVTCAASPLVPIAWLTFVFSALRRRGPQPG
jgi:hypothetical protein